MSHAVHERCVLTMKEAAEVLCTSESFMELLCDTDVVDSIVISERTYVFEDSLKEFGTHRGGTASCCAV